ncbi:hypothetical protein ACFQXA_09175 [Nocardiopsis composta]
MSEVATGTARLDLALFLVEGTSSGCRGVLEYSDELFERSTAERLVQQFLLLLERLAAEDACPVSVLPLSRPEDAQESPFPLRPRRPPSRTWSPVPPTRPGRRCCAGPRATPTTPRSRPMTGR